MTLDARANRQISFSSDDERWMRLALLMGARAQGRTAKNPPVGCVLVSPEGQLLATGRTAATGRPHAEQIALDKCRKRRDRLHGAHAYVTLEPCAHHGQTPPCADALIKAGIKYVTYALGDPDTRVDGKGRKLLEAAGVQIKSGLFAQEAGDIMAGFLASKTKNRPSFTVKTALSHDGFIAAKKGRQSWLTGKAAKAFVHDLRSRHDGVLTGIDSVLADDPQLTCRLAGYASDTPVKMLMDSHLRIPPDCQLVRAAASQPLLVFTRLDGDREKQAALQAKGVQVIGVKAGKDGRLSPEEIAKHCLKSGIFSVLIEAGAVLNKSFFAAGLIDKVAELVAPVTLGQGYAGYSPSQNRHPSMAFAQSADYILTSNRALGDDRLNIWHHLAT